MKTFRDLILMVEKEFKGYKSKGEIVNDVIPEDLDTLLNLVKDNPEEYAVCVRSITCLLYTSPSPRDGLLSRMPSSA